MFLDIVSSFANPIKQFLPKLPPLILSLILGIIIVVLLAKLAKYFLKIARVPKALAGIILSLLTIILWILLFAELAREMGMTSVAITVSGSLVILGLALSNGATSLTSDIIAGIFLAKDRDFEIGYKVKIGDIGGVVQSIDVRKVRVIDEDGKLHVIPNANIDKSGWTILERELKDDKIKKLLLRFRKRPGEEIKNPSTKLGTGSKTEERKNLKN